MGVFEQLEARPDFQRLPWPDQQNIRTTLLLRQMQGRPDWDRLSSADKKRVLDEVRFRPPAMERQTMDQTLTEVQGMQDKVERGDAAGLGVVQFLGSVNEESALFRWGQRMQEWGLRAAGRNDLADQQRALFRDAGKWRQYWQWVGDNDPGVPRKALAEGAGRIAAIGADLSQIYRGVVGSVADPKGVALAGQRALNALAKSKHIGIRGPVTNFIYGRGGTAVAHSIAGGAAETMREAAMWAVEEQSSRPELQEFLSETPRYFGEGFLWDAAFFGIGGLFKATVGTFARNLTGWSGVRNTLGMTAEQLDAAVSGANAPQGLLDAANPKIRSYFQAQQALRTAYRNTPEMGSDEEFVVQLFRKGWVAERLPDGKWKAWPVTRPNAEVFLDTVESRQFMGEVLTAPDEIMGAQLRTDRLERAQAWWRTEFGGPERADQKFRSAALRIDLPDVGKIPNIPKANLKVLEELRQLDEKEVFLPIYRSADRNLTSDYMIARGLWERSALRGNASDLTFKDYLDTVRAMLDNDHLHNVGEMVDGVSGREAWWMWVRDGAEIAQYRAASDLPNIAARAWDAHVWAGQPRAIKTRAHVKAGTPEQINKRVKKGDWVLPSRRGALTPGEADKAVQSGAAQYAKFDPADRSAFLVTANMGTPNAVITVKNAVKPQQWERTLAGFGGDMVKTREHFVAAGYDGLWLAGGRLRPFDNAQIKMISRDPSRPQRAGAGLLSGRIDREVGLDKVDAAVAGARGRVTIREFIEGQVGPEAGSAGLLTRIIAPRNGQITVGQQRRFSQSYLLSKGVEDQDVIAEIGRIRFTNRRIDTPEAERAFLSELTTVLDQVAKVRGGSAPAVRGRTFLTEYAEELAKQRLYTPGWVEYAVRKDGGALQRTTDGRWVVSKAGEQSDYASLDDVVAALFRRNITEEHAIAGIREDLGLSVVRTAQGFTVSRPVRSSGGKVKTKEMFTASDLETLIDETGWTPRLDSRYGPDIAVVDDSGGQLRYTENGITGSYQDILKELDKFEDTFEREIDIPIPGDANGTMKLRNAPAPHYEVWMRDINHRQTFNTAAEAKRYLQGGWKEFENLEVAAAMKGYRLEHKGAGFLLYATGESPRIVDTVQELHAALNEVPTPKWAPELTEDVMRRTEWASFADPPPAGAFEPQLQLPPMTEPKGMNPVASLFRSKLAPPDAFFERMMRKTGDKRPLEQFLEIERLRGLSNGQHDESLNLLGAAFTTQAGGTLSGRRHLKRRRAVLDLAFPEPGVSQDDVIRKWGDMRMKLGENDIRVANDFRTLVSSYADKFGVDFERWFGPWRRQLRSWFLDPKNNRRMDWQAAFDGNPPADVVKWIKDLRIQDVAAMVMDDDPMSLFARFSFVGHMRLIVGDQLDEAKQLLEKGKLHTLSRQHLESYIHDVEGIPVKGSVEFYQRMNQSFLLKLKNPINGKPLFKPTAARVVGRDWFNTMFSAGYLSTMGWRVWLPIRNQFQIWTTLSLWVPNNVIAKAQEQVVSLKKVDHVLPDGSTVKVAQGQLIYDELVKNGLLRRQGIPLFGMENINRESFAASLQGIGSRFRPLAAYRTSDATTRAVAYQSAQIMFTDALRGYEQWVKQGVDPATLTKRFMSVSGMDALPPLQKEKVLAMIRQGQWNGAFTEYARTLIEHTMFPYRQGTNPAAFRGIVGKLWGMFGHYPTYYLENIIRFMKHAPAQKKAAAAARFMGNHLVLYAALREAGVESGNNFLPWNQMIFTGGPYYELMQDVIAATSLLTSPDESRGRLALQQLKKDLPSILIPGSAAFRSVMEGFELAERGETYLAMLRFMSVPVRRDWLEKAGVR